MNKKYFNVDEANALLPSLRRELEKLRELKGQFEEKYYELQERKELAKTQTVSDADPFFSLECELEFMQIELRTLIESIHLKGVELKDIESGLVDFPALMDGQEVLLCWRLGEEEVAHYHGLYDGFAGRRPLKD